VAWLRDRPIFTVFLQPTDESHPRFYAPVSTLRVIHLTQELLMDIVFIAAAAGLWGLMVLLVWGFKKL
jgi:hypothetical protein